MKRFLTFASCSLILIGTAYAADTPPALAPAQSPNRVCLNAGDIDHMSYPDDKTILFHMRGGKIRVWRNDLKSVCPGLKFEAAIAYEIKGGEVCANMQVVYVLRRWTPCMLGPFTPDTEAPGAKKP